MTTRRVPLWMKVVCTLYVGILVPVYWRQYGPQNFLWFSDISWFGMVAAMWTESALLAGMMAVATLLPEIVWNIAYFGRLFFGVELTGMASYMFDPSLSMGLRGLSLFHVALPPLLVWMVWRLGYDRRSPAAQTALAWIVLPVTYFVTRPDWDINWVFGLQGIPQHRFPPLVFLGLMMLAFPAAIYFPTGWVLGKLIRRR